MSLISTLFLMETYGPRVDMAQLSQILGYEPKSLHSKSVAIRFQWVEEFTLTASYCWTQYLA